jgi:hypothetical protein
MGDHFSSMSRVKEYAENLRSRMSNIRKANEKKIGQVGQIVGVNATSFVWGYANERYGTVVDAVTGLKEIELLGVPADVGVGAVLMGVALFGGLGKYDEIGISVGAGSTAPFVYRLGAAMGRNAANKAAGGTSTQGRMGTGAAHGGRVWGVRQTVTR